MLIEEAKHAQIQSDYLTPIKKPLKPLRAVIVPIIVLLHKELEMLQHKTK